MEITAKRTKTPRVPRAGGQGRRREMAAASTRRPLRRRATTVDDLDDALLTRVLVRLASPHWFIRAAATCKRWRRIIGAGGGSPCRAVEFHRRGRNPIVGHYYYPGRGSGGAVFVPSASPSLQPRVDGRHFSLGFLPDSDSWRLVDSSGSLLLLAKRKSGWMRHCFPDLVVCEPLTRRYRLIPRLEEMKHHRCIGAFLRRDHYHHVCSRMPVPTLKVFVALYEGYAGVSADLGTATAFVFGSERWPWPCDRPWSRWRLAGRATGVHISGAESVHFVGRASGGFYWRMDDDDDRMLVHSCYTYSYSTFSRVALPEAMKGARRRDDGTSSAFRVVAGADGDVRIAWLMSGVPSVFARRREQWWMEKRLQLPAHTAPESFIIAGNNAVIADAGAGRVLLAPAEVDKRRRRRRVISIELATMKIDEPKHHAGGVVTYPYELPWPVTLNACFLSKWSRNEGWGCV